MGRGTAVTSSLLKQSRVLSLAMTLALVVSPSASADTAEGPELDFDQVCGSTLQNASAISKSPGSSLTQKLQLCEAAKNARSGSDTDKALTGIWSAVAGVCGTVCAISLGGINKAAGTYVCTGASVGGSITDAAMTKQFMGALMGGLSAAAGLALSKPGAAANAGKMDTGSCLQAATAAVQAIVKGVDYPKQDKSYRDNLKNAAALASTALLTNGYVAPASGSSGNGTGGSTATNGQGSTLQGEGGGAAPMSASAICGAARTTGSVQATVSCAMSADSSIPSFVRDPRFAQEFNDNTGIPLQDFLANKNLSPSQGLSAAMSGGLSSEQSTKIASAIRDLENDVGAMPQSDSTYAGGGSGGGSASGEAPDTSLADLMQGVLGQLMPGKSGDDASDRGMRDVVFANQKRSPAAVAEDPKLSIFDRVTYRYFLVGKRMIAFGDAANATTNGGLRK